MKMTRCHVRATYNEIYRINGARFVFSTKTMKTGHRYWTVQIKSYDSLIMWHTWQCCTVPCLCPHVQINSSDYHNK